MALLDPLGLRIIAGNLDAVLLGAFAENEPPAG
jgi:hypothetical protein